MDVEVAVLIDCDRCAARGRECADCVVTVLLGAPPDDVAGRVSGAAGSTAAVDADCGSFDCGSFDCGSFGCGSLGGESLGGESFGAVLELDDDQRRALEVLAAGGLVPRLRMVPIRDPGRRAG